MDVEVTFTDLPAGPLHLRMSRSSPGRYALHDFAKNVFEVQVTDAAGTAWLSPGQTRTPGTSSVTARKCASDIRSSATGSTARICQSMRLTRTSTCQPR